jgi:hypothetical protein
MPSERCSYRHCYYNTLTKRRFVWLKCHIQWLYLAVHGCKTYLNLNLNLNLNTAGTSRRPLGRSVE